MILHTVLFRDEAGNVLAVVEPLDGGWFARCEVGGCEWSWSTWKLAEACHVAALHMGLHALVEVGS